MNGIRMTSAQHVKDVLTETIRLLCRTGLRYQHCLKIQGLLGITVDDDQILLIHMNDSMLASPSNCDLSNGSNLTNESSSDVEPAHQQISAITSESCEASQSQCQTSLQQAADFKQDLASNVIVPSEPSNDETVACSADPSSSTNSEAIPTSVDCRCPKTNAPCCHTEEYRYTILAKNFSYDSNASVLTRDHSEVGLLLRDDAYPFVATKYCDREVNSLLHTSSSRPIEPQATPDDEANKMFVVKAPSMTSCAIIDMSTDVHEEQVVTEDVPNAPSLDNCFLPYGTSPATTCSVKEPAPKPGDGTLSDISYSEDSDEDNNDCNMSDSDNVSNGHLTQPQALSGGAVAGIRQWGPGVQSSLSEPYTTVGGAAWNLSPGLLGGVLPAGGPHSAAYYQQQILAAAAAAAHNRAARAAAAGVQSPPPAVLKCNMKSEEQSPASKMSPGSRRLPRRPRESVEKRFRCPYCELAYYHKKHLKYHLAKKHSL